MKKAIIDGILAARVRSKTLSNPAHSKRFLKEYVEDVPVEDMAGKSEAAMARAAIGGMISSTLLTLVVVPVVYTLIEDTVALPGRFFRWLLNKLLGRKYAESTLSKNLSGDDYLLSIAQTIFENPSELIEKDAKE